MTIIVEMTDGKSTKITCTPEEVARIMQAIYDTGSGGMLRIALKDSENDMIINSKHIIRVFDARTEVK